MISETRRASVLWSRQSLYDRRITFCFPLVQKRSRPDRGADMGWIPGSTSLLCLLICKWANIRSLWCWLCCPHILTFEWNTDNHVIGRWRCTRLNWSSGSWALICVDLVLFGLRKLIYTFPDKTSQLNYRRKSLCWQRWNPGRGNICLEILAQVDISPSMNSNDIFHTSFFANMDMDICVNPTNMYCFFQNWLKRH